MKKIIATLALLLAFAIAAQAAPVKFSRYSLDVPEGWLFEEDYKTGMVRIFPSDKSASLLWLVTYHKGASLMDIAKDFSKRSGGEEPKQVKDLEVEYYVKKPGEVETKCILSKWQDHPEFFITCQTGKSDKFDAIEDSFKMNNEETYSTYESPVSFDLPENWSYERNNEANVISIFPGEDLNKADSVVNLTFGKLRGPMEEAVEYFSKQYKVKEAPKMIKDGFFTFVGDVNSAPAICKMEDHSPNFLLVCALGNAPELENLALSVRYID